MDNEVPATESKPSAEQPKPSPLSRLKQKFWPDVGKSKTTGKSHRDAKPLTEVVFHTYPKLLFAWPLIVAGFLFWPLGAVMNLEILGWFYLFIMIVVILTISVDLERNHAFVWLLVFAVFLLLGLWLSSSDYQFTFFGNIYNFFDRRDVAYSRGFGLSLSLLLAGPYLVMMLWSRLNHRWRITHNEFEHYSWGRADDSLARGAKRVRSTYPDLLELLLGGAGTLIVYSATGRSELRRIPNVPMIFLVRRKINRLLESTAVVQQHDEAVLDEMEEEEETTADDPESRWDDDASSSGIGGDEPL